MLSRLRSGVSVIATVPNFPYVSHVRYFETAESVERGYRSLFTDFSVTVVPGVQPKTRFYILQGQKH